MTDKERLNSIIQKLDNLCEKIDSVRSILNRSEYELSSNKICGKSCDNDSIKSINSELLNIANNLELEKNRCEIPFKL